MLDLFASLVTLGGVHWAAQPADEEHRFGHGKAEALAALFQVVVIAISALAILMRAIERLRGATSPPPRSGHRRQHDRDRRDARRSPVTRSTSSPKTGSVAIGADRIHYTSDLLLNGAVIVALVLDAWGMVGADPLFGIAIAFWLLFGAWRAARRRSTS